MRDGCAAAVRRRRDGSATDARWTDDREVRPSIALPSHCRSRLRRAAAKHPSSVRRAAAVHPSEGRNKPYFGLMTAGRRAPDGQTTLTRGCATDALWPSVHRVSVALPSRLCRAAGAHPSCIRRLSAAQPPSIRHKAEISVVKTSLHRRRVVAMWSSLCLRRRRSRRIIVACSSHARRAVVALSSHCRRTVVAPSSHRCRIVVASSPCRRHNVVVLSPSGRQDPSSYTRNHTPHVFRAQISYNYSYPIYNSTFDYP